MQCANLDIYQGDDYAGSVQVWEPDGETAADLTGYTARAQIRTDVADVATEVVAELTIVIQLPNTILLSLHHDITATLTQIYTWDLELASAADVRSTIMGGDVNVTLEVTRALPMAS